MTKELGVTRIVCVCGGVCHAAPHPLAVWWAPQDLLSVQSPHDGKTGVEEEAASPRKGGVDSRHWSFLVSFAE